MPNVEEWCEVRTSAGVFRDWTSVSVSYSMADNWWRHVVLELAEVTPPGKSPSLLNGDRGQSLLRLKPGDRIEVALAGQLVITGYIKTRQAAADANRHIVQIIGLSNIGPIRGVSVDVKDHGGGQFRNYSLSAIANAVLKPIGVSFRLENPPTGADDPFKNFIIHDGETPWDIISRLARQRAVWLKVAVNGDMIGGNGLPGAGAMLEEGRNILAVNCFLEFQEAGNLVAKSQTSGSDDLWGRNASEISATASIAGGDPGKKIIVLAEEADRQKDVQLRADMDVSAINASTLRVMVTHRGWLKPGGGGLWQLQESATVKSPMMFPFAGGQMDLLVWGVTMSQDNHRGTITQVELVNKATFSRTHPNAQEPAPFGRSSSLAVPDGFA